MKITIGAISQPGTARANKTGSWRINSRPHFLHVTCTACNMCVLSCPEGCIYGNGRSTYYSDYDYCKGCGNCAAVCPVDDIEMVAEVHEIPEGVFSFGDEVEQRHISTA